CAAQLVLAWRWRLYPLRRLPSLPSLSILPFRLVASWPYRVLLRNLLLMRCSISVLLQRTHLLPNRIAGRIPRAVMVSTPRSFRLSHFATSAFLSKGSIAIAFDFIRATCRGNTFILVSTTC